MKRLHRLIVTSATYRQSSRARPELAKIDPENRLLARQRRIRLDAEIVRDVALAASGLLSPKIGGPSVFPPQPEGLDLFTQSKKNWKSSAGEDRYRRGMYAFFWRSSPYPLFAALDAPNANTTCTRRSRSNTPVSALMLANDQSLFELAQALGASIVRQPAASDAERLRIIFRRCLARAPTAAEGDRLLRFYDAQLDHFRGSPADAEAAAGTTADAPRTAAWIAAARVLMNLDEFITRE